MATKEKTKSWTEIKLRDPDRATCAQMELIMQDKHELAASKALERYIQEYSAVKSTTADLRSLNMQLRDQLEQKEGELQAVLKRNEDIRNAYERLTTLIQDPRISISVDS